MNEFLCNLTKTAETTMFRRYTQTDVFRQPPDAQNTGQSINYTSFFCSMKNLLSEKSWWLMPLFLLYQTASYGQHDIALTSSTNVTSATRGSEVIFTITVKNEGLTNLTGVKIKSLIPTGTTFISSNGGVGTYDNATGIWDIGAISSATNSVVLNVKVSVKPTAEGVIHHSSEVSAMGETDVDSAPNNASLIEDDYTATCVTVPMLFCTGSPISVDMTAPTGYSSYKFFKNGNAIPVQNSASETYRITSIGSYTYETTTASGCVAQLCCPVKVDTMPLPIIRAKDATICNGLNVDLAAQVEDINPNTALGGWGYFSTLQAAQDSTPALIIAPSVTPSVTTIYYIRRSFGSCYVTASVTVNVTNKPVAGSITATIATCSASYTPNNDAKIDLTGFTNGLKVAYSTTGAAGLSYASAVDMTGGALSITGLPNPATATTYTVRVYSTETCYTDVTVLLNPKTCSCETPSLSLATSTFTATSTFDLATTGFVDNNALTASSGVITYHPSLLDANANSGAIGSVVNASGDYWIRKTITQGTGNCYSVVKVTVTIQTPGDLAISKTASVSTSTIGSTVSFTVKVTNEGHTTVDGVKVTDAIPAGTTFVSATPSQGTYDAATGIWDIGTITAATNDVTLTINLNITGDGVIYNKAEITAMVGLDTDSSPTNPDVTEDDIAAACISVPMLFCEGSTISVLLTAPTGYGPYRWLKDGVEVQNGATNTYTATTIGSYTFTTTTPQTSCSAGTCCPLVIATKPLPTIQATDTTICNGASKYLLTLVSDQNVATAGGTWSFFLNQADANTNNLAGQVSPTVTPTATTPYFVRRTFGTCYATAIVNITVTEKPVTGTIAATLATCSATYTPNNDAKIDLIGFTNGLKAAYSTTGVMGLSYASAVDMTGGVLSITGLPNPATVTTYTVRIYNTETCYTDVTVDLNPKTCPCETPNLTLATTTFTAYTTFDLATTGFVDNNPLTASSGVITYHRSLSDANTNTGAVASVVNASGDYWIRKTATQGTGNCYSVVKVTVTIQTPADLAISKTASVSTSTIGSNVSFTIKVTNEGHTTVDGVKVTDAIPAGTTFVSATPSQGTYDAATGIWDIGTITAATNDVTLTVNLNITGDGVIYNKAEITAMDGLDTDSSPTNHDVTEDDIAAACISVPMLFCEGAPISVVLTAPSGYGMYRWLKDGVEVLNSVSNTYTATAIGSYSFETATPQLSCGAGTCCPIVVATKPRPTIQVTDTSICAGATKYLLTLVRDQNAATAAGTWSFFLNQADTNNLAAQVLPTVTPTATTQYFVRRTFGTCYTTSSLTITVYPRPNAGVDTTLTCNAGVSNSTYNFNQSGSWAVVNKPAAINVADITVTTTSVSGLTAVGAYDFELTNGNGCKDTVRITVQTCPCPMPNLAWTGVNKGEMTPICVGQTGDISTPLFTDSSSVAGTITYHNLEADALSGNNPMASTQVNTAGTYWVRKQATNGTGTCYDTLKINVIINPNPVFTATNLTVCEGTIVNLNNRITNLALATGTQTWKNIDAAGSIIGTPTTVTIAATGNYYFEGTTAAGCSGNATITMTATPKPVFAVANATLTVCEGTVVNLDNQITNGADASVKVWKNTDANGSVIAAPTTVTVNATSTYYFEGTTAAGCVGNVSLTITVTPKPVFVAVNLTVCEGTVVNLNTQISNIALATGTQVWKNTNAAGSTIVAPTTVTIAATGTYYFEGTTAAGCSGNATITITANPKPNLGSDFTLACIAGVATTSHTFTQVGTWAITSQPAATASIAANGSITGMTAVGTYAVEYTDANGCKDTLILTSAACVCPMPDLVWSGVNKGEMAPVCAGQMVDISTPLFTDNNNVVGTITYHNLEADALSGNNPMASTQVNTAGTYWVRKQATNGTGTCYDTLKINVTINPNPVFTTTNLTICEGTLVNLDNQITNIAAASTKVWKNTDANGAVIAITTNMRPVTTNTYYFEGTTAAGCVGTATLTIVVNPKPELGLTRIQTCTNGLPDSTFNFNINGTWSIITQPVTGRATVNNNSGLVEHLAVAGDYDIEVSNIHGCKDTVRINVPNCACANSDLVITNIPAPVCAPAFLDLTNVIFTDSRNINGTVAYFATAADAASNVNPLTDTRVFTTATYWIRKTSNVGSGACYDTASVLMVINPKPDFANVTRTICEGDELNLTTMVSNYGLSDGSRAWKLNTFTGANVPNALLVRPEVPVTGYYFIGTTAAGCRDSAIITVNVNAKPNLGDDNIFICHEGVVDNNYDFQENGAWRILSKPVNSNPTISAAGYADSLTLTGNYVFEYINSNICKDTVQITIPNCPCSPPNLTLANQPAPICAPDSVNLAAIGIADANNVTGRFTYHTSAFDASTGLNPLPTSNVGRSGNYWVRKQSSNGSGLCYHDIKVVVKVNPKPNVGLDSTFVCNAQGIAPSVYDFNTAATGTWTLLNQPVLATAMISNAGAVQNMSRAGLYDFEFVDLNQCKDSVRITIPNCTNPCDCPSNQDLVTPTLQNVPPNTTVTCPRPQPAVVTATDNCTAVQNIVITLSETVTDSTHVQRYKLTRVWTATDACGNTATASQIVIVKDTAAPIFNATLANRVSVCTLPAIPTVTASDNCGADVTITYAQVVSDSTNAFKYTVTRIWTATDENGNAKTISQIIRLNDSIPPLFVGVPANATVECTPPTVQNPVATDNCAANITVVRSESKIDSTCAKNYKLIRVWTATDAAGNTAVVSQTISVMDTTRPMLVGVPANATINCGGTIPTAPNVTATDACDNNPIVVMSDETLAGNCVGSSIIKRTWTATDLCGNRATAIQLISIGDFTAPLFGTVPSNVTVNCNNIPVVLNPTFSDNCDQQPTLTYSQSRTDGNCLNNYTLTRTWVATDACNNVATTQQTIVVQDTMRPMLVDVPANVTVNCNAIPTAAIVTATDVCSATRVVMTQVANADSTLLTRTWTATDSCGNVTVGSQQITIDRTGCLLKIQGIVWNDTNGNGTQNTEPRRADITVILTGTDANGNPVTRTVTTDANGAYVFDGLNPGNYRVRFVLTPDDLVTYQNQGNDLLDSDINPDGFSETIALTTSNVVLDAGLYRPAKLGDLVWMDDSRNGLQAAGEAGVANVTVNLTGTTGNGTTVTLMTTTDANGLYLFSGLRPGTYQVSFVKPLGFDFTTQGNNVTGADDSNANPQTGVTAAVTLVSGDDNRTIDAGLVRPILLSSVGDSVWEDTDGDGIQDANEVGIGNVIVLLDGTDANGNPVTLRDTTDANGLYQFDNLLSGTYHVTFLKPAGYEYTYPTQGTDSTKNSDANPWMGNTPDFFLAAGQNERNVDAGFYRPAKLGDLVWLDNSRDGVRAANEVGVPNVIVTLTGTTANGDPITLRDTTDANGFYLFEDLRPGVYQVTVDRPNGYTFTTQGANIAS
ncbi:MAG: hypothetical protein RL329_2203, partial [Bacteroidota bacterium]